MKKGVGVGGLFLGAMGNNTLGGSSYPSMWGLQRFLQTEDQGVCGRCNVS